MAWFYSAVSAIALTYVVITAAGSLATLRTPHPCPIGEASEILIKRLTQ
jgi:hypothetical protein